MAHPPHPAERRADMSKLDDALAYIAAYSLIPERRAQNVTYTAKDAEEKLRNGRIDDCAAAIRLAQNTIRRAIKPHRVEFGFGSSLSDNWSNHTTTFGYRFEVSPCCYLGDKHGKRQRIKFEVSGMAANAAELMAQIEPVKAALDALTASGY